MIPETTALARRHDRVRATLSSLGLDALIVTASANIRYLTNHAGSAGLLVVTQEVMHLLLDFRYREAMERVQQSAAACPSLRIWDVPGSYDEALLSRLGEFGAKAVGFEAGHVSVQRHDWWKTEAERRVPDAVLRPTEGLVEQARLIKDATEIETLRESCQRLGSVAKAAFSSVRPGVTERHVAASVEAALREAGYDRPSFDVIVASGPNGALPHHLPDSQVLAQGDLLVLDFGGVLDGYCSDLTRTVAIGRPSAESRRIYDAVFAAHQAAIAAVRPGIDASTVDEAARSVLSERGLGDAFGHGTGHGLGLDIHEEPRIGRRRAASPSAQLAAGMVFTIEPGAYVPGFGGVRIEDDVLVTDTGCEILTDVPRDLLVFP